MQRLVGLLKDDDERRRWTAAAAVSELGLAGLDVVLTAIAARPMGERLRQGYIYILEHQPDTVAIILVRSTLAALRRPEYRVTAPLPAFRCLQLPRHVPHAGVARLGDFNARRRI